MRISSEGFADLHELRACLDRSGYNAVICALLGGDYYRWPACRSAERIRKALPRVPSDLRLLLRLLLLGEPVSLTRIKRLLPQSAFDGLTHRGYLQANGRRLQTAAGLALIPAWDKYLWVDHPDASDAGTAERVYIGDDSYIMASQLRPVRGRRALDIGTGTGLLALLTAGHVSHVLASDVDELALERTRINAALNGLQATISPIASDMFTSIADQPFDYICANPPFLPVPDGVTMPPSVSGGRDGMDFLRSILQGLETHLAPGGRCQVLCSTPVLQDGSMPVEDLGRALCRKGFDCSLVLLQVLPARQSIARRKDELAAWLSISPEAAAQLWRRHFRALGIKSNGVLLVQADRRRDGEPGSTRVHGPLFPAHRKKAPQPDTQGHRQIGEAILSRLFEMEHLDSQK